MKDYARTHRHREHSEHCAGEDSSGLCLTHHTNHSGVGQLVRAHGWLHPAELIWSTHDRVAEGNAGRCKHPEILVVDAMGATTAVKIGRAASPFEALQRRRRTGPIGGDMVSQGDSDCGIGGWTDWLMDGDA
jgi:hypothetical protein